MDTIRSAFAAFLVLLSFGSIDYLNVNAVKSTEAPKCDNGWHIINNQKCVKFFNQNKTFTKAGEFCRQELGSLVIIKNLGELYEITSLLKPNKIGGYWIGLKELATTEKFTWVDGSELTVSNWSPHLARKHPSDRRSCVYMESRNDRDPGKWGLYYCTYEGGYICEKPTNVGSPDTSPTGCTSMQKPWSYWCYWIEADATTWQEANRTCSVAGGNPIWFYNLNELFFAKSLIGYNNISMWTGINRLNKMKILTYATEYIDMHLADLQLSSTTSLSKGSCAYLKMGRHKNIDLKLTNCSTTLPVICKSQRNGYTIPPLLEYQETTPMPLMCPYNGFNSVSYKSNRCVKYFSEIQTFETAEKICQSYGGHLPSISSSTELDAIFRGIRSSYTEYWIGLNFINDPRKGVWVDGSTSEFRKWVGSVTPTVKNSRCVSIKKSWSYSRKGMILSVCSVKKRFICVIEKESSTKMTPPTVVPFDLIPCSAEGSDWFGEHGYCYKYFTTKKSWFEALKTCRENSGDLVSLHSVHETDLVMHIIHRYKSSSGYTWIGFNMLAMESSFIWTDNSPINYVNPISSFKPDDVFSRDKCVTIQTSSGKWKPYHCGMEKEFMCKKVEGSKSSMVTFKPPVIDGFCARGWIEVGSMCYKLFRNQVSWTSAWDRCKRLGPGYDLASIKNEETNTALTLLTCGERRSIWIGLNDRQREKNFVWSDNTPVTYSNWAPGEPGLSGDCVVLKYDIMNGGYWEDQNCYRSNYYLCQSYKDPTLKDGAIFGEKQYCRHHPEYTKFGHSCYGIIKSSSETFFNAKDVCKKHGGQLAVINNYYDNLFVKSMILNDTRSFWIDLIKRKDDQRFKWSSHWPVMYTNWGKNEPNLRGNKRKCTVMSTTGLWSTQDCMVSRPFVCKIIHDKIPEPRKVIRGRCPSDDWFEFGTENCYFFDEKTGGWHVGGHRCSIKGANLASFHSDEELKRVSLFLKSTKSVKHVWIGLFLSLTGYKWQDGTPLDYLNWQMKYNSGMKECVQLNLTSGQWIFGSCSNYVTSLCSIPKNITGFVQDNPTATDPGDQRKSSTSESGGLSTGGSAAIVIVFLIVITGLAVAGFYYFRRRKQMGSSDATHAFSFDNEMYDNN